ncbi:MAG: enoyl-CoA hydratase/isomerase family protein [Nitriliruptoraceae bacterium]
MTALTTSRNDGVFTIVFSNPEQSNIITDTWVSEMQAALAAIDDTDRCVLLRADGKNFCFGGDVASFATDDPAGRLRDLAGGLHDVLETLATLDIPVVQAVQGWAAGGGFSLALASDITVAGTSAKFKAAYNGIGLTADGGLTFNLPRRTSTQLAFDMLLTDRVIDANEALARGLVARVVDDSELVSEVTAIAERIAANATFAVRRVKKLLRTSEKATLTDQLADETEAISQAAASPDGREGVTAFLERRAPTFNQ